MGKKIITQGVKLNKYVYFNKLWMSDNEEDNGSRITITRAWVKDL